VLSQQSVLDDSAHPGPHGLITVHRLRHCWARPASSRSAFYSCTAGLCVTLSSSGVTGSWTGQLISSYVKAW